MIKRIGVNLLSLAFILTMMCPVAFAITDNSNEINITTQDNTKETRINEVQVENLINSFFKIHFDAIKNKTIDRSYYNSIFIESDPVSAGAADKTYAELLYYIETRKLLPFDASVTWYSSNITIDKTETIDDILVVDVTNNYELLYSDSNGNKNGGNSIYTFKIKNIDNDPKIYDYTNNNEIDDISGSLDTKIPATRMSRSTSQPTLALENWEDIVKKAVDEFDNLPDTSISKADAIESVNERRRMEEEIKKMSSKLRAYSYYSYNASNAVNYARSYAYSAYNKSPFTYYGGEVNSNYGGDCTNFTSIALNSGGLPMNSKWNWYGSSNRTASWSSSSSFYDYASSYGTTSRRGIDATLAVSLNSLIPGDIVQFYNGSRVSHSTMVVSVYRDSFGIAYDLDLAMHSPNQISRMSSWLQKYPVMKYWWISGAYN